MNLKSIRGLAAASCFLLLIAGRGANSLTAETIRIASWNAQSFDQAADRNSTMAARLNTAAVQLGSYQPDVLLLQEIPDYKSAVEFARSLGEGFQVNACSMIEREDGTISNKQVAIISRLPSGLSWIHRCQNAEGEPSDGVFAFASLKVQDQWLAVGSLLLPDMVGAAHDRESAIREYLSQMARVAEWKSNRPTAYLFGGTVNTDAIESVRTGENTLSILKDAGFTNAFLDLPMSKQLTLRARAQYPATTADYIFADAGGFAAPAEIHPNIVSDHSMLVVDYDIHGTMPVPPPVSLAAGDAPSSPAAVSATSQLFGVDLKWWVVGLGLFVLLLLLVILFRSPARLPASAMLPGGKNILFLPENESGTAADTGASEKQFEGLSDEEKRRLREAMRPHMMRWLKEKFVGGLVNQRQEMIETQHEVSDRADDLGRRVELIQEKLLKRIQEAEQRVTELQEELAIAKAENRELIESNLDLAEKELKEARQKAGIGG